MPLSPTGAELLFETFSQRYERGSTIITSNLPFEDWMSVLGSERLTGALLDRLTHHVSILAMNGDSYRLRQSAGRRRAAARAEQNQATAEIIDPDTGEITPAGSATPLQYAKGPVGPFAYHPAQPLACFYAATLAWNPIAVDRLRKITLVIASDKTSMARETKLSDKCCLTYFSKVTASFI